MDVGTLRESSGMIGSSSRGRRYLLHATGVTWRSRSALPLSSSSQRTLYNSGVNSACHGVHFVGWDAGM